MSHRNMPAAIRASCRLILGGALALPGVSHAFGDEGHEVVALVARTQMTAQAIADADRLLSMDKAAFKMREGGMTPDSWARQAPWADYYRTSQTTTGALPNQIHSYAWRFVDIELHSGSLQVASFAFPDVARGSVASHGPDPDCVVNKIERFETELSTRSTPDAEKRLALKFLMHFVGDLHQPLHASDNLARGGNDETATAFGSTIALHSHWDTTFVEQIGATAGTPNLDAQSVANALRKPTPIEAARWLGPADPRNWALESYALAQDYAYGPLPTPNRDLRQDRLRPERAEHQKREGGHGRPTAVRGVPPRRHAELLAGARVKRMSILEHRSGDEAT